MEQEIAAILMTIVRSIVDQSSSSSAPESILHRVHLLRNAIVLRMDWHVVHSPIHVCNHILSLLRGEQMGERRRLMSVVCDLVFSTLIGHNAHFTYFVNLGEDPDPAFWRYIPRGPMDDDNDNNNDEGGGGGGAAAAAAAVH
jgi:hypothetical protein